MRPYRVSVSIRHLLGLLSAVALSIAGLSVAAQPIANASTLPSGFADTVALGGLTNPVNVQFAPDGRIFVAQKNGVIKVFASLSDPSPVTFADLSSKVDDYWDRGLLGMALDPAFPTRPYVYVLYTYDAPIGGTAPTWNDACPTPPGPTTDGCLVAGRVSRLTASGSVMTGTEQVLVEDWCQQFPSHSIGSLLFGRDGKLYVSGGDGASFNNVDYGQYGASYSGDKANPCGDLPAPAGTALTPPTAEGGALRSQSVRRTDGPATLNGAILRIDPDTGAGLPDNPYGASSDPNARRIVAFGLRNPFRFTQRPGTDELWIGDVGWNTWEEIDRVLAPTGGTARNFGWPCYEGNAAQSGYQGAGLTQCSTLYANPSSVTGPHYTYNHSACVVVYSGCRTGGSSITGIAFYGSGNYPTEYNGALFFADHTRNEIWAMLAGTGGVPDPANLRVLVGVDGAGGAAGHPVDLKIGPGGDLFYADMEDGTVHRIIYTAANQPPTARMTATPTTGNPPLTVAFDGSGSSDPEGRPLTYSWDLNGDGTFGDATGATASWTYSASGSYVARLQVTDDVGASNVASTTITVGNTPPTAVIDNPSPSLTWKVGDTISFSGHATDAQDGLLPSSALTWELILHHCATPTNCHTHSLVPPFSGAGGSFSAPDHAYPCWLEIRLTATDSAGLTSTATVRLDPKTVALTFKTNPAGLKLANLTLNDSAQTTPFTNTVVVGSANSVSAPPTQTLNRSTYNLVSWSDGGAASHTVIAPAQATSYTATYRKR
jgi:glucose/arabinose dehydrogenase